MHPTPAPHGTPTLLRQPTRPRPRLDPEVDRYRHMASLSGKRAAAVAEAGGRALRKAILNLREDMKKEREEKSEEYNKTVQEALKNAVEKVKTGRNDALKEWKGKVKEIEEKEAEMFKKLVGVTHIDIIKKLSYRDRLNRRF